MVNEDRRQLFVGCFDFGNIDTEEEGTFQVIVAARDVNDAAAKCRTRLDLLARTTDVLGPVNVYVSAFIELPSPDLTEGVLVNHQTLGECVSYDLLPTQGCIGATEHDINGEPELDETREVPLFWTGVDAYRARWKLYWCETDDHDEDWFVVARNEDEAQAFHENAEGYEEGDASAEFVRLLPASEQRAADRLGDHWPSKETLLACGAEFLASVPQDGANALRAVMGSGSRVVRIDGRVFGEGDIVANVLRSGGKPVDG